MKGLAFLVLLAGALGACGSGDDTTDGTRGQCAEGGALNDCPEAARTAEGACWRLVDCAAIPLHTDDNNVFDWDNCVNTIESMRADSERLVVDCIAASSCDELKTSGSPYRPYRDQFTCLRLGDQ